MVCIAERTELTRRATSFVDELQVQLRTASESLEDARRGTLDISADLTRQYKTMQTQLTSKVLDLQATNRSIQGQLGMSRAQTSLFPTPAFALGFPWLLAWESLLL